MQAQLIVPIDELSKYHKKYGLLPDHTHFKDVNGILDKYTGTWEGSLDNKSYYFLITKKINVQDEMNPLSFEDGLVIQFKITDKNTGKVLYDKFKDPERFQVNNSDYLRTTKNKYAIYYVGDSTEEINCGDIGRMFLELIEVGKLSVYVKPNHMAFSLVEGREHPCPNGRVIPPFPNERHSHLILTKK